MKGLNFYAEFRMVFVVVAAAVSLFGCKSPGTVDVAALTPVPLSFAEETISEALTKLKSTPINPDAISRQEAFQYILSRDIYAKGSVSPDTVASSDAAASQNKSSVNEKLGVSAFTPAGGLLKGTLQINSRNTISNLADLYEWRIANELLFSFKKALPEYDFYYVPAMVTISPGPETYRDFYVRVTFAIKIYEDKAPPDKPSFCKTCKKKRMLNNYFVYCNECELCNRSWWKDLTDRSSNEKYGCCEECKLCNCPTCREKLRGWIEKNDASGRDSKMHLFALSPFRQFDNQSEALSNRWQTLATLAAAATAKAGPANVSLDSYYSILKRLEKDFAQITKAPVVTSFASSNRRMFGWNIYPSPAMEDGQVVNVMTPDSWRFSAIIAVNRNSSSHRILVTPQIEWIRLPETYTWFTTDKIRMPVAEPFALMLQKDPVVLQASAESACLVSVSGISLDRLSMDDLKVYPIDGKDEMKFTYSFTSHSSVLLQLTDKTLEDKKVYRVVWTPRKNIAKKRDDEAAYQGGAGQFKMLAVNASGEFCKKVDKKCDEIFWRGAFLAVNDPAQVDTQKSNRGKNKAVEKKSFTVTFEYRKPDTGPTPKPGAKPDATDKNAKKYKFNITLDGAVTEPNSSTPSVKPETSAKQ